VLATWRTVSVTNPFTSSLVKSGCMTNSAAFWKKFLRVSRDIVPQEWDSKTSEIVA
jgi:hypothetical protein